MFFLIKLPISRKCFLKYPCQSYLHTGCEAKGTSAEDILDQDSYDLPPVIRVSESRGVTTVVFNLAPDNMRILTDPVSMTDTELIQVFGPQPDRPYTEEEYLEVIAYAFADYLDGDGAAGVLSAASVTVRVGLRNDNPTCRSCHCRLSPAIGGSSLACGICRRV